ncbi:ATP-binding cassette domain-containing protein [Moraxella bovoculi]|nr:ATP-binding cassette domain-containing protein [Moraxella bovoculi]
MNLTIAGKQSVGLLGRNRAGKSTLLRIICGLDEPDSGEVVPLHGLSVL